MSDVEMKVWIIVCLWAGYFIGLFGAKQAPGYPEGVKRWHLWRAWLQEKPRARYLCGYHAGAELRPGLSAVVDGNLCEMCAEENPPFEVKEDGIVEIKRSGLYVVSGSRGNGQGSGRKSMVDNDTPDDAA